MAQNDPFPEIMEWQAALGHLASGVGHHVINAYSAIVSNAEILRLSAQSGQSIDSTMVADLIVNTAMEASTVARRLIDFTRPLTLPGSDQVALDHLISKVVEEFQEISGPHVQCVNEVAPMPKVSGNANHLRAMLLLLLTNAREALTEGRGTIRVSTHIDPRGWIVLEIRDHGEGMTSEVQERAIEPFFSTKPGRPGVGLSIANGIWRRHRGTLAIQSQPWQGTLVRLCMNPGVMEATTKSLA